MPAATFHYYIPQKADNLFFEVDETDVPLLSQLPLDKFHRNEIISFHAVTFLICIGAYRGLLVWFQLIFLCVKLHLESKFGVVPESISLDFHKIQFNIKVRKKSLIGVNLFIKPLVFRAIFWPNSNYISFLLIL